MKYPASRHYSHLSIHDPIPEIELRFDEYQHRLTRPFSKWVVLSIIVIVLLYGVILIARPSQSVLLLLMPIAMIALATPQVCIALKMRKSKTGRFRWQSKADPWGVPFRHQVIYQTYYFSMIALCIQVPSLLGGSGGMGMIFGIYMVGGGIWLTFATQFMREPGQISCEKCSYPLIGLRLPCDCPECGKALLNLSYTTDRPKIRDSRYLIAGILLIFFGGLILYLGFNHGSLAYRVLPRGALMRMAPNSIDAFDALVAKELTDEETDRLEEALINEILNGDQVGFWSHKQGKWLSAQAFGNGLSSEQLDRLLTPMINAWIDAPSMVPVGTPVHLRIDVDDPDFRISSLSPEYFFGGFIVGDDPTPHLQQDSPKVLSSILRGTPENKNTGIQPPLYIFEPSEPGTLVIRASIVWAICPTFPGAQTCGFRWNPDGSYSIDTPPVWSRVVDLERTVEITP